MKCSKFIISKRYKKKESDFLALPLLISFTIPLYLKLDLFLTLFYQVWYYKT